MRKTGFKKLWRDLSLKELGKLADAIEFEQPQVGLFFRARLTGKGGKIKNPVEVAKHAIEQGVAFVPGAPFYPAKSGCSTSRLGFANADVRKILARAEMLGLVG